MVNNRENLWMLKGLIFPAEALTDSNRMIHGGPVFDLDIVKQLLDAHGFWVINNDVDKDLENEFSPPMSDNEIKAVLQALRYELHDTSQWVRTSAGQTMPCDAYLIKWNRNRQIEWEHGRKLYVKFGYRANQSKCLLVSFHNAKY